MGKVLSKVLPNRYYLSYNLSLIDISQVCSFYYFTVKISQNSACDSVLKIQSSENIPFIYYPGCDRELLTILF